MEIFPKMAYTGPTWHMKIHGTWLSITRGFSWHRSQSPRLGVKRPGHRCHLHSPATSFLPFLSLAAQLVKNLLAVQEIPIQFLGWEDPLEERETTHSSILAWRIPMDRGARWATRGHKESDIDQLSTSQGAEFLKVTHWSYIWHDFINFPSSRQINQFQAEEPCASDLSWLSSVH